MKGNQKVWGISKMKDSCSFCNHKMPVGLALNGMLSNMSPIRSAMLSNMSPIRSAMLSNVSPIRFPYRI